jgi:formylglycine-generating enzyme required for sulfatase activity
MHVVSVITAGVWVLSLVPLDSERGEEPAQSEMVLIEGATFTMGTPIKEKLNPKYHHDEAPLEVTVKSFQIGKYPVTAEQMCAFLNSPADQAQDRESLYNHQNIGEYVYSTIMLHKDGRYVPRPGAAKAPANQVTWKGLCFIVAGSVRRPAESTACPRKPSGN